jgi:cyclophilin family peptidyl-prolyl cis-trans isomerase
VRRNATALLAGVLAVVSAACSGGQSDRAAVADSALGAPTIDPTPTVVLETNLGRIVMQLDRESAPRSVENFLRHMEIGFYDGLIFHRVRPGFMVQAGTYTPEMARRRSSAPPIRNESDNGVRNLRGTVAMARTADPHGATTQFFINLVDNAGLDYRASREVPWGYAVFGSVTQGMDVVDSIARIPTRRRGPNEAVPEEPIIIVRAFLQEDGAN